MKLFSICIAAMLISVFAGCAGIYLFENILALTPMVVCTAVYLILDGLATFGVATYFAIKLLHNYASELTNKDEDETYND